MHATSVELEVAWHRCEWPTRLWYRLACHVRVYTSTSRAEWPLTCLHVPVTYLSSWRSLWCDAAERCATATGWATCGLGR